MTQTPLSSIKDNVCYNSLFNFVSIALESNRTNVLYRVQQEGAANFWFCAEPYTGCAQGIWGSTPGIKRLAPMPHADILERLFWACKWHAVVVD